MPHIWHCQAGANTNDSINGAFFPVKVSRERVGHGLRLLSMRPPKADELSRVLWLIDELEGCVRRLELRPELMDMILTLRNGVSQELAEIRRNPRNSMA